MAIKYSYFQIKRLKLDLEADLRSSVLINALLVNCDLDECKIAEALTEDGSVPEVGSREPIRATPE